MLRGTKARSAATATLIAVGIAASATSAEKAAPWEAQPFTAEPKAVLSAARAAAGDTRADVVVLLDEARYTFDERGRSDLRYKLVYLVLTEAGAREWASVGTLWAPWYEERPVMQARVVTPAGEAHVLDPKTIGEVPVAEDDPELMTDRKRLRAPLPAVVPGAVVEEEVRSVDREPYFAAGTRYRYYLGNGVPTRKARVVVDAPEALALHYLVRGAGGHTVERERAAGRVRLRLEAGPLAPIASAEPWMPSDRPRNAAFVFSTSPSWAATAEAYGRIVDAQIGAPSPASLRAGVKREEVAARLLRELHAEVRYTGLEFGEAAIVPRTPAEVRQRRYGDCKDKSALLVSRLRAAGIPAYLALLSVGPGADVEPDLPGFGDFDHAIVAMPGSPTLWIDATDEFARVGELPSSAQDRLALIAAPGTTGLTRTPATASADNVLRKRREYQLATPGRIVESTAATGWLERAYRSYLVGAAPDEVRESQEKYARAQHQAAEVVSSRHANPRDLQAPFELTVESRRAGSTAGPATVSVDLSGLLAHLPRYVGGDAGDGGPSGERHEPFALAEPHRIEWSYRIVPPPGAVLRKLPEPEQLALGEGALGVQFTAKPDGVVEGRVFFDSGPRQVDAASFQAMHEAVRRLREREPLRLEFEEKALALAEAGKTCEALAERRLAAAKEPKSAVAQEKLAHALLEAGFGEPARDAARRAVQLDPKSSSAQRWLGWALEHDALGRRFKPGWDAEGALAAYRAAKQLDPRSAPARQSLAILLEHNEAGVHYGPGARLDEAVAELQALRGELQDASLDLNLLMSLMHLRRFDEVERASRTMPASTERDEILLLSVAARRGAKAALHEATRLFPDARSRRDALLHAGNSLVELRLYPEAAALIAESVAGADDAAARRSRADLFARVKRHEELPLDPADARTPVKRLYILSARVMERGEAPAELLEILDMGADVRFDPTSPSDAAAFRKSFAQGVRARGGKTPFSSGLVDVMLSVAQFVAEGDADVGYRVRMVAGDFTQSAWVVRRGRTFKVLALEFDPAILALEAWKLADSRPLHAARWLDWVRDEMKGASSPDDPAAGPVFLELWKPQGRRDSTAIRVAAASLIGGSNAAQAVQTLETWRAAVSDAHTRFLMDRALLFANARAGRYKAVQEASGRLLAAAPESKLAWDMGMTSLRRQGLYAEARAMAEARLARKPDDPDALRALASVAAESRQYDEAERRFARLEQIGRAVPGDLNNRAWNAIFRGAVDDTALEWARVASEKSGAAALHTLATLNAERGRTTEAMQLLVKAIDATAADELQPHDWYVVGRVAEACGLADVARAGYARAGKDRPTGDSSAVLASRGLERLASKPESQAARTARKR
jgi:tetratricopeptide (TPR) repeat protein